MIQYEQVRLFTIHCTGKDGATHGILGKTTKSGRDHVNKHSRGSSMSTPRAKRK